MAPQEGDSLGTKLHTTTGSIKKLLEEKKYELEGKDSAGNTALHAQVYDLGCTCFIFAQTETHITLSPF